MEMLSKEEYLMMFCDVDMPGMDGLELLEIVREKYPAMPIVMFRMRIYGFFRNS